MGGIKNFFVVIVSVLLFFSVFSMSLFGILSSSLTYENVYQKSSLIFEDVLSDLNVSSLIEERYPYIVAYCQNNSEFVFSEQGYVFDIPCESALQGTEAILDEGIKNVVKEIYYEDYSMNFSESLDELQDAPLFLISEQAHNTTKTIFDYSILISSLLIIALFFLVEKKSNAFLIPGIYLVLNSVLFFKIDGLISLISEGIVSRFLEIFFSTSFNVSIRLLIIGIVLVLLAVIFKVFKIGFWISSTFEKFKKKTKEPEANKNLSSKKK